MHLNCVAFLAPKNYTLKVCIPDTLGIIILLTPLLLNIFTLIFLYFASILNTKTMYTICYD